MRNLLHTTFLAMTLVTTVQADVQVVQSSTRGINKDYPKLRAVTVYLRQDEDGPSPRWTPTSGDTIIQQICATNGEANIAGTQVLHDYPAFLANAEDKSNCQIFTPGLLAPLGQPIMCFAQDCTITGWMR